MTDDADRVTPAEVDEALLSRLALIDERPLSDRSEAYRQLHDELRSQLEATDADTARPE